ncbi:MAG: LysR substrate-binding domain-containing protein [Myxococcaceae bacterium]
MEKAEAVLRPTKTLDLSKLARTFTLRTSDGFVETFGPALLARVEREAPGVRLRFLQKLDKDSAPLRDGAVDLETGVVGETTGPEVRMRALFRDRFVGVVRAGHPLARGKMTPARYAAGRHAVVSRRGIERSAVDDALAALGLERAIVTIVGGFGGALALARASDLIATVPDRHTLGLRQGLLAFALPVPAPQVTVSMLWHPRMEADPAHRWLRGCVRDVCVAQFGEVEGRPKEGATIEARAVHAGERRAR